MSTNIPQLPITLQRPLAFFDLETTGVSVQNDRIVEIAIVKFVPAGVTKELSQKINPGIPIPKEASAIHGIYDADVALEPTFEKFAPRLSEFLKNCDLSGFNVRRFDIPLLLNEFNRCKMDFDLTNRNIVDAQTIFHLKEPRDLSAAYRFYCGKEHAGAHNALADVRVTAEVFAAQLTRYSDLPRGLAEIEALIHPRDPNWVDDTGKFVWQNGMVVINFGRYKGKTLQELVSSQPEYLEWMTTGDFHASAKSLVRDALSGRYPKAPGA